MPKDFTQHDRRTGLTALEVAEASPYLAALGNGRQAAISYGAAKTLLVIAAAAGSVMG